MRQLPTVAQARAPYPPNTKPIREYMIGLAQEDNLLRVIYPPLNGPFLLSSLYYIGYLCWTWISCCCGSLKKIPYRLDGVEVRKRGRPRDFALG